MCSRSKYICMKSSIREIISVSVLFANRSAQWWKMSKVNLVKIEKVAWTIYLLFLYIELYFVRPEKMQILFVWRHPHRSTHLHQVPHQICSRNTKTTMMTKALSKSKHKTFSFSGNFLSACTKHQVQKPCKFCGSERKDMRQTTKPLLKRCRPFKYNKSFLQRTMAASPSTAAWRLLGFSSAWTSLRNKRILHVHKHASQANNIATADLLGGNTVKRMKAEMHGCKENFLWEPAAEQTYLHLHALTESKYVREAAVVRVP